MKINDKKINSNQIACKNKVLNKRPKHKDNQLQNKKRKKKKKKKEHFIIKHIL